MDNINIFLRGGDTALALLLEAMENKYSLFEFYCIYSAVCTPGIVFDNFKHAATAKALQNLNGFVLLAMLRKI